MPKVLITGGLGFVGSYLVRECLAKGDTVRILDNSFRGRTDRLQDCLDQIELLEGDLLDAKVCKKACEDINWVFHLAAINGTKYFYEIPHKVLEVNVKGFINIFDAAKEAECSRFLVSSSSELYHLPDTIPTPETVKIQIPDITNPRFSYAGSKIIAEQFCLNPAPDQKLESVVIRYHNIYGPNMGVAHVIPEIFRKIKEATNGFSRKDAEIEIQGDGSETRAFCYAEDAVRATRLALESGKSGEIYHIGTQRETAIRDLIEQIGKMLAVNLTIKTTPVLEGSTPRRCPDISKMKSLGYKPEVDLEEGLKRTLTWYQENADVPSSAQKE